jgi:hypothetical protein
VVRAAALLAELPEHGSELEQVLALLRAASDDEPETLPVAAGDRRLLALHRELTGRSLELLAVCSGCGTSNELALGEMPDELPRVAVCGARGGVRAPVYGDLIGLPEDRDEAVAELLRRCTVGTPERAPRPEDLELVDDSLVGPIETACVECGAPLEVALDVERIVLIGLQEQLARIDHEVHLLARTYHWDLDTIERLPDERRARLARLALEDQ